MTKTQNDGSEGRAQAGPGATGPRQATNVVTLDLGVQGASCARCVSRSSRPPRPLQVGDWLRALDDARRHQAREIRLRGVDPLADDETRRVLREHPVPAWLDLIVETHGLAVIDGPAQCPLPPVARWDLTLHHMDPIEAGRPLSPTPRPRALEYAWSPSGLGRAAVRVVFTPSLDAAHIVQKLPAWALERFGVETELLACAPERPTRARVGERILRSLVEANRVPGLRLLVDHRLPLCLREHLPIEALDLGSPVRVTEPPDFCHRCPRYGSARCPGLGPGWRAEAEDAPRLLALARLPAFRTTGDAEALALQLGLRDAYRLMLPERHAPIAKLWLERAGVFVCSSGAVEVDEDENVFEGGALPSAGQMARGGRARRWRALYMGREQADAERARDLDGAIASATRLGDALPLHRELGQLLGYPSCCVEAFIEDLQSRRTDQQSPFDQARLAARALEATEAPDPLLNHFLRERDQALLSHAPCRYDCPASRERATRLFDTLAARDPAQAAQRRARLASRVFLLADGSMVAAKLGVAPRDPDSRADTVHIIDEVLDHRGVFDALPLGPGATLAFLPASEERAGARVRVTKGSECREAPYEACVEGIHFPLEIPFDAPPAP